MEKIIGGKLVADALIDRGVDYIFSLSGGHITPIYQFLENKIHLLLHQSRLQHQLLGHIQR